MRPPDLPSPAIVVGIDGSHNAISAALWAVDEAISRDIPLRLVYVIEPHDRSAHERDIREAARELATADIAVRAAVMAVESTDEPVKIEVEIAQDRPARVLREQSRSAPMLCLAALGIRQNTGRRVGSTAAALAVAAHCPVAVIRGHNQNPRASRWVVAVVDESPESHDVLELAVTEALLRRAPLRVLTTWHPRFTDMSGADVVADNIRHIRVHQERMLSPYRKSHPELDARPVAVHGNIESYLAHNAGSIGLVVIERRHRAGVAELLGLGHSMLHDADCSVLICPVRSAL